MVAGITQVQQVEGNFASGTTNNLTIPATQSGSLLVAIISEAAAATAGVPTMSDNGGGVWINPASLASAAAPPADNQSGVNSYVGLCYALDVPAGITQVTSTLSVAKVNSILLWEFAGVAATVGGVSDGAAGGGGGVAATTFITPAVKTVEPGDLVIGAVNQVAALAFAQASGVPGSGWTEGTQMTGAGFAASAAWQIIRPGGQSCQCAWTGTSGKWGAITMAFKAALNFTPSRMPLGV